MNYYRLRQVDFDGGFEYSPIKSIRVDGKQKGFSVMPNPYNANRNLRIQTGQEVQGTLSFYDQTGRKVYYQSIFGETGFFEVTLPGLPSGIYTMELVSGHERFTERLVVE